MTTNVHSSVYHPQVLARIDSGYTTAEPCRSRTSAQRPVRVCVIVAVPRPGCTSMSYALPGAREVGVVRVRVGPAAVGAGKGRGERPQRMKNGPVVFTPDL